MFDKLKNWWNPPVVPERKILDTSEIRAKIQDLGWKLWEIPIKNSNRILRWKLIATKGEKSVEVGGAVLENAMRDMGIVLGAIPKGK